MDLQSGTPENLAIPEAASVASVAPVPQGLAAPPAPAEAARPDAVPPSGLRYALRQSAHTLGWATKVLWWPCAKYLETLGKDIARTAALPRQSWGLLQALRAKNQADGLLWQSWTLEERRSVQRQQSAWLLAMLGALPLAMLGALLLPALGLLPVLGVALAWYWRPRYDVVRRALGLPQLPPERIP